jgi:hypothetical protein
MRKVVLLTAMVVCLTASPALAKVIGITASPNPASVGSSVRHTVEVGTTGRLDVWVSASGFRAPGLGTLPPGAWVIECCPGQTAGTVAWHYRSSGVVTQGVYRFNAVALAPGLFRSTAAAVGSVASVWVRIR